MNILLTGTAGFIGFHVAKHLLERGDSVIGLDNFNPYYDVKIKEDRNAVLEKYRNFRVIRCDLHDTEGMKKAFESGSFDVVCNLAAQAGVRYSLTHPHAYVDSNITGFLNILEGSRHAGIKRLVYASSSSVYGGNTKLPFSEQDRVDTPVSLYAASKKSNELMAHCYSHLYGFQTIGHRFFTVYGPWGRPDMAMWLFTKAMLAGEPIKVFNKGDMQRDFTYIDDIVQGVVASLDAPDLAQCEVFNLGNNRSENLVDLIGLIEKCLGCEAQKELLTMQMGDVKATYADIRHAKEKLDFKPSTPISEGVPKFLSWYRDYHKI
ncbi:MAG: NAD-dependent epimerase/dehydratase family protein [Chitinivibrionales bacterium]|nr:NAD-dependent epimerase/dehydratase family protein [Chitinivibrionales bacterium]